jgi:hypothetical protein
MFKYSLILMLSIALPLVQATGTMAEVAETNIPNRTATQQSDSINFSDLDGSPEAIERERELGNIRKQKALEQQLEWRRKYGDLAPSRQNPAL